MATPGLDATASTPTLPLRAHSPAARPTQHRWASIKTGAPPRRPMGHRPSAGITEWSPMHPGARRQRPLPRACLHPPGGARTPARRLISWGPPAIWPTRAHPQAHCSTEAPANTARRLGRGSMTSPATACIYEREGSVELAARGGTKRSSGAKSNWTDFWQASPPIADTPYSLTPPSSPSI